MSIEAIKWAFDFEAKNSSEKAILLALANYAGGDGRCHPGQESIAKKASCTDRTVRAVLADLEERGVIARERRVRKDGSRTSDTIVLLPMSSQPENPSGSDEANRKIASSQPENPSGLTSFEPSVEPSAAAREKSDIDVLTGKLLDAVGEGNIHPHGALDLSAILGLTAAGVDLETDILPTIRARASRLTRPVRSWAYFTDAIRDAYTRRIEAGQGLSKPKVSTIKPDAEMTPEELRAAWAKRLNFGRMQRQWFPFWGPMPGQAGCTCPPDLLEPKDGQHPDGSPWDIRKIEAA